MLPRGAKILDVQRQGDQVFLWALVDPTTAAKDSHRIRIFGTGHGVPNDPMEYVGTFQLDGGALVFHAFHSFGEQQSNGP